MIDFVTGITRTVNTWEEFVAGAAKSNLRRQSQTVGSVFWQPALFDVFCPFADNKKNCLVVLNDSFIPHKGVDPFGVALLEVMVQPELFKERDSNQHQLNTKILGIPRRIRQVCYPTYYLTLITNAAPIIFFWTRLTAWCALTLWNFPLILKVGVLLLI